MDAILVFEDVRWTNFKPLTWTRPVCLLRTGIFPLWEKVVRACRRMVPNEFEVHIHTRNYLAPTLRHCLKGKGVFVNEFERLEGKSIL
ncbi:MAG: putative sugar nucleotidyl transferase, partial [Armatimonadetes bacterium]|nr:putative sugar nucleotidyl transferase [Armatimonadota bacterium]